MKTSEEYFAEGRRWLVEAEERAAGSQDPATLAVLAMANAMLAICARLIAYQEDD